MVFTVQEDPSVQIASETMEAFQVRSEQGTVPAELPEAVLQLLPKTLYRGKLLTSPVVGCTVRSPY